MTKELSSRYLPSISRQSYSLDVIVMLICLQISSTDDQLQEWIQTYFLPSAPVTTIQQVMVDYPQDPTQGSPYDTGVLNDLSPQFKRIASFQGDLIFQAPRRFFLQQRSGSQNTWAFREQDFAHCKRRVTSDISPS